jgi:hypothetical protein
VVPFFAFEASPPRDHPVAEQSTLPDESLSSTMQALTLTKDQGLKGETSKEVKMNLEGIGLDILSVRA